MARSVANLVILRKPKRWRLQFRLRTLLITMGVVAVPLALVARRMDYKRSERAGVAEIISLGGVVWYDWQDAEEDVAPPGPQWLRSLSLIASWFLMQEARGEKKIG